MTGRRGTALLAAGLAATAGLMLWGAWGMPPFGNYPGPYGDYVASHVMDQRRSTEAVTATAFDYRGFDTIGEEFILFVAAVGVSVLLRRLREEQRARRDQGDQANDGSNSGAASDPPATTELVQLVGRFLVAPVIVLGVYVVSHGHLTPGGGFQGGVVIATAAFVALLAGRRLQVSRLFGKELTEVTHSIGAGGFVAVGTATLGLGAAFLQNILPLGTTGQLTSAGFIPIVNALVGLEVASAFVLIVSEFLIEAEGAPEKEEQTQS